MSRLQIRSAFTGRAAGAAVVAVLFIVVPANALSHSTPWSWTEPKAAKMVKRDARVMVPTAERTLLERELRDSIRTFVVGQLIGRDGDAQLPDPEHYAPANYRRAREKLRDGLAIESAICRGSGPARAGRFKHFRCSVTSEVLEVPKRAIAPPTEEGGPPTVILGPSRFVGPLRAQLDVHVTGRAAIKYRQVG